MQARGRGVKWFENAKYEILGARGSDSDDAHDSRILGGPKHNVNW